ncbi:outer membrane beta-barrel protein [Arsenophonus sp. aPb]|uniref:outer membrane protein n=1 Tax=Arsenophonus sp. aPb TaxID=3041619 RepID=UPI0024693B38|nr:outer membrane beta-barrel protein [Arsenophonus sp. aPb]WGL99753.1 outer membrane beta-barrel protein [Arsenophonus sp. aPb]
MDFTTRGDSDDSYSGNDVVGFPGETFVKNQIDLNTLMLNAYYDFKNSSNFTPYLSAGLGYAYISQKTSVDFMVINPSTGDKSDRFHLWTRSHATNNFAWSAGAGIKYTVNKDFSFDLNYKYLNAGQGLVSNSNDLESKRDAKTTLKTHDIMLSATYHF